MLLRGETIQPLFPVDCHNENASSIPSGSSVGDLVDLEVGGREIRPPASLPRLADSPATVHAWSIRSSAFLAFPL